MVDRDKETKERWSLYHLLIIIALAVAAGRIAVVRSPEGDTAFLSANDRSRWSTVASLVEHGTYSIDHQIAITNPIKRNRRPWDSIDKVRHLGRDGKQHHYSSKPPLLATMVAGVYKVVLTLTGMTLTGQPLYVARILLALVNLPLLAIFYYATIASIDRLVRSRWAATAAAAACCFGTMVLPFAISLNNHLAACTATAVTMWIYTRFACRDESEDADSEPMPGDRGISFPLAALAGFGAAMAAANELPALSMTVLWFVLFALLDRRSILPFSLGAALVAAAFFGTNWIAHESLRPPYAHRGNGPVIAELASNANEPGPDIVEQAQVKLREQDLIAGDAKVSLDESDEDGRWIIRSGERQYALLGDASQWQITHWDDWYEYPGTYWRDGNRRGVDRGEPSRWVYFMNMTVGHHGIFSLTPVWILMPIGLIAGLRREPAAMKRLFAAILLASLVCFAFYLKRPLIDRNYGGVSICFRWLLWFAPLWLLAVGPMFNWLERGSARRWVGLLLLASSTFSVAASLQTPWQSPWIYQFWRFLGWIAA